MEVSVDLEIIILALSSLERLRWFDQFEKKGKVEKLIKETKEKIDDVIEYLSE